MAHMPHLLT